MRLKRKKDLRKAEVESLSLKLVSMKKKIYKIFIYKYIHKEQTFDMNIPFFKDD